MTESTIILTLVKKENNSMNKIVSLIKTALVFGTLAVVASAYTLPETNYLASFVGKSGVPVPVKVTTPSIGQYYAGDTIKVSLKVDSAGKVKTVKVVSEVDGDTKSAIENALYKWEFKPLTKNGLAVASTVELPIKVASN